jgi:hypothetical protein
VRAAASWVEDHLFVPSKHTRSARKGKAVEHLIAATCVLATSGELNALTALVDDEGVDIGFKRRDGTRVLDVQVKSRFSDEDGSKKLREEGTFVSDVREETFRPRADLFMLFVAVNGVRAKIETAWLVPSLVFDETAFRVTVNGKQLVRFQASVKEASQDKWRELRLDPQDLPATLLRCVADLEPEVPEAEDQDDDTEDIEPD